MSTAGGLCTLTRQLSCTFVQSAGDAHLSDRRGQRVLARARGGDERTCARRRVRNPCGRSRRGDSGWRVEGSAARGMGTRTRCSPCPTPSSPSLARTGCARRHRPGGRVRANANANAAVCLFVCLFVCFWPELSEASWKFPPRRSVRCSLCMRARGRGTRVRVCVCAECRVGYHAVRANRHLCCSTRRGPIPT